MVDIRQIAGFDWDVGNNLKSSEKRGVSQSEAESIFFNDPLIIAEDAKHSHGERRMHALGQTTDQRLLHVTFTLRKDETLLRVVSARDMNRKERTIYEQS